MDDNQPRSDLAETHSPSLGDTPSEADSCLDEARFEVLLEATDLALQLVKRARRAAVRRDRDRSRLYACQTSRCVRTMLVTIEELCRDRRRA
jgi:hypothetical protein